MTANTNSPTEQLAAHVAKLQTDLRNLKPRVDQIAKELAMLGFKPNDPVDPTRLPIDEDFIARTTAALKDGGKNVKTLQRALGIFDYTDMTKTRKVLVAAGVTKETENYQGTNATFIELCKHDVDNQTVTDEEEEDELPAKRAPLTQEKNISSKR